MLRTLGWVIWLFGYIIGRLPLYWRAAWLARHGRMAEKNAIADKQVKRWSGRLMRHIKLDLTVAGAENLPPPEMPVVYASNHQSFLDIPVILDTLTPAPAIMARRGIMKVPLLRGWMKLLDCVIVDREDARASVAALKEGERLLRGGKSLVVFPEGTRSRGDEVAPFLPGAVRIAWKAGVPIVPLAVDGTYKGLEGGGMRVKPAKVRLTVLPRVETAGLTKEAQKALPGRLEEAIRAAKAPAVPAGAPPVPAGGPG